MQLNVAKPQPHAHFDRPLINTETVYKLIFLISSLISINPVLQGAFYPACLFYIFNNSEVTRTIGKSVTKSGEC